MRIAEFNNGVTVYRNATQKEIDKYFTDNHEEFPVVKPVEDRLTELEQENESLSAKLDYLAMMTEVDIPTDEDMEA